MKRIILSVLSSVCLLPVFGSDSSRVFHYGGLDIGAATHFGLDAFNDVLLAGGASALGETNLSSAFHYDVAAGKFVFCTNWGIVGLNNKTNNPKLRINLNFYSVNWHLGFNLLGENSKTRVDPFVGFGLTLTQLIAQSHDSTVTTTNFINGAQNMYFESSNAGFSFDAGIRFCKFSSRSHHRAGLMAQAYYSARLNPYKWMLTDMPLEKIAKLNFSAGVLFRFR